MAGMTVREYPKGDKGESWLILLILNVLTNIPAAEVFDLGFTSVYGVAMSGQNGVGRGHPDIGEGCKGWAQ